MVFTISTNDEEANDVGPVLDRINRNVGRYGDERMTLAKGRHGGRQYGQASDDPTLTLTDSVALGGQLIQYEETIADEKLEAIGEACKIGDCSAVRSLLGFSRLGSTKKYVGVDLGFKCQGHQAAQTFMKALPADLEALDLSLKGNQLMLPGIKVVAEGLPKKLKQLKVDLSSNKIQAKGVEIFMKAVPQTVTSLTIGCSGMRMGLPGVKAIADNLPQNLIDFTIDLHDGLVGDEGCVYLSQKLPKTLQRLEIHLRGEQAYLTNRGYWIFDRLINDPDNPYGLPLLTLDNFECFRNSTQECVKQYEMTEKSWELVQRWGPHENVC